MAITVNYLPLVLLATCTGNINYWNNELYHARRYHHHHVLFMEVKACQHLDPKSLSALLTPVLSKLSATHQNLVITQMNQRIMSRYTWSEWWPVYPNICPSFFFPQRGLLRLMTRLTNFNKLNTKTYSSFVASIETQNKAIGWNLYFL